MWVLNTELGRFNDIVIVLWTGNDRQLGSNLKFVFITDTTKGSIVFDKYLEKRKHYKSLTL